MLLTALVTAALCCLVRARLEGRPWRWLPLAGVAMGFATLTKGPVGIAVPLLAWGAGRGALPPPPRRSGSAPIVAAALALALVVVPWLVMVARQEPGFLRYAVLDETLLRLVSRARFHRGGPIYFYAETLAWALGPWGILLAALTPTLFRRWRAGGRDGAVIAFAARAAGALVVFFTLSASKRPHYILPAIVPLALLAAAGIAADPQRAGDAVRMLARWLAVAGVAALLGGLADVNFRAGEFRVLSAPVLTAAGLVFVLWGVGTAIGGRRPVMAVACCALLAPGLGLALLRPLAAYADTRSSRRLAAEIDPEAEVVCFDSFRSSLPFYLGRPITLASDSPRALTSNYIVALDGRRRAAHGEAVIPTAALVGVIASGVPLYVLASRWNAEELTRLSPRPLVAVNGDSRSILFRPRG
jgi:4-amino-4-deoxy-L-arabinose transferase-like glycosyltransferase